MTQCSASQKSAPSVVRAFKSAAARSPSAEMLTKRMLLKSMAEASWGSTTLTNSSDPRCTPPQGSCGETSATKSDAMALGKASASPANEAT
jgi:hypothetical protein